MPRSPHVAPNALSIRGSVYSALLHKMATHEGEVYPLHVGDTWKEPPAGCRVEDVHASEWKGLNQYTPPQGHAKLLDALVARIGSRTGSAITRSELIVTAGATVSLAAVAGSVLAPGDEVLVLAPHWPLVDGIVRMFGATPLAVHFYGMADTPDAALEILASRKTDRTAAVYVNTPNNPTGRVLPRKVLEALAEWARREELWLFFDEVYEDYVYEGEHTYGRPLAPERSFSMHSFSKAYGMAGYRCGYVVGPAEPMREVLKMCTHTAYSAATPAQLAALRVLGEAGDDWIRQSRADYADTGRRAARRLGLGDPQGSTFLFLDVASHLDERGLIGFLDDCADEGLFAAPGPSFGPFPTHLRICTTSAPPDVVLRGVEVLARKMGIEGTE